ncbi:Coiled-coil domain-containing protein 77 [Frankliniella fusca]|uniref:Coiled-coil domain-containing protein 77 n=1 Tax=Frankliniella fusca TaxID=407009 RepID=A0AAE1HNL4_9NEOP|nr:Coiled-coil domain-containing protein 77 [Frankliniella fusca]
MSTIRAFLEEREVPEEIIKTLLDEGYDLKEFSKLTYGYLHLLNFKTADVQRLFPLIGEAHRETCCGSTNEPSCSFSSFGQAGPTSLTAQPTGPSAPQPRIQSQDAYPSAISPLRETPRGSSNRPSCSSSSFSQAGPDSLTAQPRGPSAPQPRIQSQDAYPSAISPLDHIYCRKKNTGWITNASRAIQSINRCRNSKKRKTTPSDENQYPADDPDDLDSDGISEMATLVPGSAELHDITEGMRKSFRLRETFRENGTDVSTFVTKFPHLMTYNGEMLRQEFKRMRPNAKDLCRSFLPLLPKSLELPWKYPVTLSHEDDTIRALMKLSQYLPHDVHKRQDRTAATSTCPTEGNVINYISSNQNVDDYVEQKRADSPDGQPVQPYLLAIVSTVTKKVQKYFVVVDDTKTQLPPNCQGAKAIEYLIATYLVFHLEYPFGWRNTFHFLSSCFLEVFESREVGHRKDGVTPSERELWLLLKNK